VELLIELFGRCERTNIGINAPTGTLYFGSPATIVASLQELHFRYRTVLGNELINNLANQHENTTIAISTKNMQTM